MLRQLLQGGDFCGIHNPPKSSKYFHIVLNLQESPRVVAHPRTQPLQHTVLLNLLHRTQPLLFYIRQSLQYTSAQTSPLLHAHKLDGTPASSGLLSGSSDFQNGISHAIPLLLSVRTHKMPTDVGPIPVSQSHRAMLPRVPNAFAKTVYSNRPTLPECVVELPFAEQSGMDRHWHHEVDFPTALKANMNCALCNAAPVCNVQRHLEELEQRMLALHTLAFQTLWVWRTQHLWEAVSDGDDERYETVGPCLAVRSIMQQKVKHRSILSWLVQRP